MNPKLLFALPVVAWLLSGADGKRIGVGKASELTKKELQDMVDDMLLHTPVAILNKALAEHDVRVISSYNRTRQTDEYPRYRQFGRIEWTQWAVDAALALGIYVDNVELQAAKELIPAMDALKRRATTKAGRERYNALVREYNAMNEGTQKLIKRYRFLHKKYHDKTFK